MILNILKLWDNIPITNQKKSL